MKIRTKLLLPVMALFSNNSQALDWLFEPNFSINERYTDNLRMQVNPIRDNFITTISPGILLGYLADDNELKTTLKWNELIYHGESDLNFSEKIANFDHQFRSERFKTGLTARYAEQSSINRQLDSDGSGNLQLQIPRTTRSIAPTLTYNLSETNAIEIGFNYTDVAYQKDPGLNLSRYYSSYSNHQYSGTFIHTFSERLSINLTGSYAEFSTSATTPSLTPFFGFLLPTTTTYNQKASTFTYQAGFQYAYDPLTRFSFSAGMRNTNTKIRTVNTITFLGTSQTDRSYDTSGQVFSANLNRKFEWGSVNLQAGQQITPASTGGQRNTTTFSVGAKYNLDERLTAGIDANYLESEQISAQNNSGATSTRTYISVTPNIRWRWTPDIHLELSYSYRHQKYDSINRTSVSNGIQLQFSYQPQLNRQVK